MVMENQQSSGQTKKCPKCNEEIQLSAKVCKHCQADLRNWFVKHKVLTGILVLFAVVIFNSNSYKNEKLREAQENIEKAGQQAREASSSISNKDEGIKKVGESVKIGGAIITVNKVETSNGGQYSKPQAGNQWINLNITIENTESSQQYVTTMGQMFLKDGDGNSYQVAVTDKAMESVNNHLDGAIIANSKRTGWVGFEVKKGVTNLQFQYNGSLWGGNNITVALGQ